MTVHENNLENSTPIVVVDIYNQDDVAFVDKAFCIMATIESDSVNISPLTVSDVTDQIGDKLTDKPYCIMATIDKDSVNISPIVVANMSSQIDEVLTDNAYCVITTIENDSVNISPAVVIDIYDQIADALTEKGYYIAPQLLPETMTAFLSQRVTQLNGDDFQTAGIGRKQAFQLNQQIRSDETRWLTVDNGIDASYLDWMSTLRTELNQRLYMGLFKYEAHYAHYAPGAYYQRHVDAFKGQSNRVLTTLLYLNPDWQTTDGGELVIYHPETEEVIEQILPEYGKFIVFLSDQFPHQVLSANRDRYSIAGWFHINDSLENSFQ
jgi:SM-20-related protein